jgi:hypothetical protein
VCVGGVGVCVMCVCVVCVCVWGYYMYVNMCGCFFKDEDKYMYIFKINVYME